MGAHPSLTEADISGLFDGGSFSRGRGYYRGGHIIYPNRRGNTLTARCIGSLPEPYEVEATLRDGGILSADCSCPIGSGGHCKHVVALLLTWIHEPESFVVMADVTEALQGYAKEELILLIRMMLNRRPDLLPIVQMPILGSEGQKVDSTRLRETIRDALRSIRYSEWDESAELPEAIPHLLEVADYHLEAGRWSQAETIHRIFVEEALDHYERSDYGEAELVSLVASSAHSLGACLGFASGPQDRERILTFLLSLLDWGAAGNSIGLTRAVGAALTEHAMPEERQRAVAKVRELMPLDEDTWPARWKRWIYGHLWLELGADDLDDDTYLELCRETGQGRRLVERLLQLGRLDEALDATREMQDDALLELAELFVSHGQMAAIAGLLLEREETGRSSTFTEWLRKRALDMGDAERALELSERLFWRQPSLARYGEWRDLAQTMGRWRPIRATLLRRLAEEELDVLLTQIYLDEGEYALALDSVEQLSAEQDGVQARELRLQAAQAVEEAFPQEALILYGEEVELLIAARGRENYREAAQYLCRMRDLYLRMGQGETWDTFIAGLQADNKRLYALREEMAEAGL